MTLHGKRDPEAERRRIEKAQAGGFGQPGVAGRPRKDSTEIVEERAAERMEYLVDKALDAIERGLKSGNEGTALKAAGQFFKTFHHPTQKHEITGEISNAEYHLHVLQSQDNLSESDQQLLNEFLGVLRDAADEDIVDAEVVEPKELPEGS
jgi:hypothetical protein